MLQAHLRPKLQQTGTLRLGRGQVHERRLELHTCSSEVGRLCYGVMGQNTGGWGARVAAWWGGGGTDRGERGHAAVGSASERSPQWKRTVYGLHPRSGRREEELEGSRRESPCLHALNQQQ